MLYLVIGQWVQEVFKPRLVVTVREEDMLVIEPALQRIIRNGLNPNFTFLMRREDETSSKDSQR